MRVNELCGKRGRKWKTSVLLFFNLIWLFLSARYIPGRELLWEAGLRSAPRGACYDLAVTIHHRTHVVVWRCFVYEMRVW